MIENVAESPAYINNIHPFINQEKLNNKDHTIIFFFL
jgi:hypothetical protein